MTLTFSRRHSGTEVSYFKCLGSDGSRKSVSRLIAEETAIAISINGIGYAVLMATAQDLEDLAFGFILSERLADHPSQILDMGSHQTELGVILRVNLVQECNSRLFARVRHRTSESSCGMCGLENLEQAFRPLPTLRPARPAAPAAVFKALDALRDHQDLNRLTGGAHAAALCEADGTVSMVREDIGRHNAFDKLIGAMARQGRYWGGGFALLSSRCSFELVEKAILSGCPTLVTISAPTALAIRSATEAGLELLVLARPDSLLHADVRDQ